MGGAGKLRILLIGWTLPPELEAQVMRIDRLGPSQTFNFYNGFLRVLDLVPDAETDLISFAPLHDFPSTRKLLVNGGQWKRKPGSHDVYLPFINFLGLKHLSRYLAGRAAVRNWLRRTSSAESRLVIVGGVHSVSLALGERAARRAKAPSICVMTDPPGVVLPSESLIKKCVRKIDNFFINRSLRSFRGIIALTDKLAADYGPQARRLVIEGFMNAGVEELALEPLSISASPPRILYAGQLVRSYGLELLYQAFKLVRQPAEMHILGKGEMEDELREASLTDERIKLFGFLQPSEVYEAFRNATVLVNLRPASFAVADYSFPSKLLEYVAAGGIVLTTKLSGIPTEYAKGVVFVEDESPKAIAEQLDDILLNRPAFQLKREGAKQIARSRTALARSKDLASFIKELLSEYKPVESNR